MSQSTVYKSEEHSDIQDKQKLNKKTKLTLYSALLIITLIVAVTYRDNILKSIADLRNIDSSFASGSATINVPQQIRLQMGTSTRIPIYITSSVLVNGLDIKLKFDNTKIKIREITSNLNSQFKTFLPLTASNAFDSAAVISQANVTGTLSFGALTIEGQQIIQGFLGSQTEQSPLMFLTVDAIGSGISQLNFEHQVGNTTDSNVASAVENKDILQNVQNGTITIDPQSTSNPTPTPSQVATSTPNPTQIRTTTPTARPTSTATPRTTPVKTTSPSAKASQSPNSTPNITPVATQNGDNFGLLFDGRNDVVSIKQTLPNVGQFTAEAIFSPTRNNATGILIAAGDDSTGWSLELVNGRPIFWIANQQNTWYSFKLNSQIARNTWNHLAVTYNNGLVKIFHNGKSFGQSRNMPTTYKASSIFQIGGLQKYPHYPGIIDAVKISESIVYESDFNSATFLSNDQSKPIILYQFNESQGQAIINNVNSETFSATRGLSTNGENNDPSWVIVKK